MAAPDDFDRVGDLLGDCCEAASSPSSQSAPETRPGHRRRSAESPSRGARGDTARELAAAWPEIAGAEVAANATPVQLKAGRLVVSTSSSVWAANLQYIADDLAARLSERLGPGTVRRIVFRQAGWEERSRGGTPTCSGVETPGLGELSEEQKEALARLEDLDLPPAMRATVARAMRAAFIRSQRDSVR
jgi:hypothetical protein